MFLFFHKQKALLADALLALNFHYRSAYFCLPKHPQDRLLTMPFFFAISRFSSPSSENHDSHEPSTSPGSVLGFWVSGSHSYRGPRTASVERGL